MNYLLIGLVVISLVVTGLAVRKMMYRKYGLLAISPFLVSMIYGLMRQIHLITVISLILIGVIVIFWPGDKQPETINIDHKEA